MTEKAVSDLTLYSWRRVGCLVFLLGCLLLSSETFFSGKAEANTPVDTFFALPGSTQAGGHADVMLGYSLSSRLVQGKNSPCNCEDAEEVIINLPAGVIGDPSAAPLCDPAEFALQRCPVDSQVGAAELEALISLLVPIYNLTPRAGEPGLLGFNVPAFGTPFYIVIEPRTGGDYGLRATAPAIQHLLPLTRYRQVLWGVPADPKHDATRFEFGEDGYAFEGFCDDGGNLAGNDPNDVAYFCSTFLGGPNKHPLVPSNSPQKPFMQNPTTCGTDLLATIDVISYDGGTDHAEVSWPTTTGCDNLGFNPSLSAQPTTQQTDSASGLDVDLNVPQPLSPFVPSPSQIKSTTVTLPEGFSINPNAADGKTSCADQQARFGTEDAAQCPEFAKVGTLTVESAVLPGPLPGYIYLGEPLPGNRYRLFLVADGFGVHIKLPGTVSADPQTGRIITAFRNLPQSPFQRFSLHFFGSERGLLATPNRCGIYQVDSTFEPWNSALPNQSSTQFFTLSSGPNGTPCPGGSRPFAPRAITGMVDNTASQHSPFLLKLTRNDGDQTLSALNVSTPPGFSATLRGIPYCPEAAIAASTTSTGAAERAAPKCPQASRIGRAVAGAGAGSSPLHVYGEVYLAGPYKGAPLSLLVITPAVSGPYDLGNVVVRVAIRVNPSTAQVSAISDPLPQILEGIPLRLRSILVELDRPGFTLNPTNCDPFSVDTTVFGTEGASSDLRTGFQVANCSDLGFEPRLTTSLTGSTKRTGHPALTATLLAKDGDSNLSRVSVTLPRSELLDQGNLSSSICTRVQLAANSCPAAAIYGSATAITPLLDEPISGPVYLASGSNELPDLLVTLRGQIDINLRGRIDTVDGAIRTIFEGIPDAPISKFTLRLDGGARKGLLVNRFNICQKKLFVVAKITGQSGRRAEQRPRFSAPCGQRKAKRSKRSKGDR